MKMHQFIARTKQKNTFLTGGNGKEEEAITKGKLDLIDTEY